MVAGDTFTTTPGTQSLNDKFYTPHCLHLHVQTVIDIKSVIYIYNNMVYRYPQTHEAPFFILLSEQNYIQIMERLLIIQCDLFLLKYVCLSSSCRSKAYTIYLQKDNRYLIFTK